MSTSASLTLKFMSKVGFENEFSTSCDEFMKRLSALSHYKIVYQHDNTFTIFYDRIQHFRTDHLRISIEDLPILVLASLDVYDGEDEPLEFICQDNTAIRVHLDDVELEHLSEDNNLFDLREDL